MRCNDPVVGSLTLKGLGKLRMDKRASMGCAPRERRISFSNLAISSASQAVTLQAPA